MKFIYLIKCEDSDNYKIGFSSNPEKRLKELQVGHPFKLNIISTYDSIYYNEIENSLHNKYGYTKKTGEWFTLSLEDEMNFIDECEKIHKNIDFIRNNNIVNGEFLL